MHVRMCVCCVYAYICVQVLNWIIAFSLSYNLFTEVTKKCTFIFIVILQFPVIVLLTVFSSGWCPDGPQRPVLCPWFWYHLVIGSFDAFALEKSVQ